MLLVVASAALGSDGGPPPAAGQPGPLANAKAGGPDDALPEGALVRLGTLHWRHAAAVTFVAFLPDGDAVLTGGLDNTLHLWDRATGKEIRHFTIAPPQKPAGPGLPAPVAFRNVGRTGPAVAMSPDGKTVATALPNDPSVHLWEVATGKPLRQIKSPPTGVVSLLFSPDSKTLAVRAADRSTHLLEADTGKPIRRIALNQKGPVPLVVNGQPVGGAGALAFSPDGKTLATVELEIDPQKTNPLVLLTEVDTGKEIRRIDALASPATAVAFSPDGNLLAIGIGTAIQLREPRTGNEIRQFNAPGATALLFAADSKTLVAKTRDQVIRLWDAETGKPIRQFTDLAPAPVMAAPNPVALRLAANEPVGLAISPDGKTVAAASDHTIRLWDATTGNEEGFGGGHRAPVTAVSIATDGKTLVSRGADRLVCCWNLTGGKQISNFREPAGTTCVAVSPDGKLVALGGGDALIRVYDVATGKPFKQLKGHANGGTATLAFAPDGKTLASYGTTDIKLFDVTNGTELRRIALRVENPAPGGTIVIPARGPIVGGVGLAFSADSRTLLAQTPGVNPQLMMAPGAMPAGRGTGSLSPSPDGRVVAIENGDQTLSLWEVASGKERTRFGQAQPAAMAPPTAAFVVALNALPRPAGTPTAVAFSPDGRLLAGKGPGPSLRLWEVRTGTPLGQFKGHAGTVDVLAFAPDGKTLASGSSDTTILVWDVAGLKRPSRAADAALVPPELAGLWADLLGDDAGKAYQGVLKLAAAPKQSVPFLRDQLKPVAAPDVKELSRLIRDLDSDDFEERSAATTALEKLGVLAEPALEKTLTGPPITLEMRRRIEALLGKLVGGALSTEQVRQVRAVEALEEIGTPEARQVLEGLADGAPAAMLTRQAQAALGRLGK
jgi:WD40 repeat protein